MSRRTVLFLILLLAALPLSADTVRLGPDVAPLTEALELKLDPAADGYSGTAVFSLDVKKPLKEFDLHAEELKIESVTIDGIAATFANGPEATLVIRPGRPLAKGMRTMTIAFSNDYDRDAVGLYKVVRGGDSYLFTQFEAIEARKAFPCWDEPGFKTRFTLTATIPSQDEIVFNTPVAAVTAKDGWKTVRFGETKPLPSYLVAFAAGPLEFTDVPGTSIPTRIVTIKGESNLTGVAVQQTPKELAALESYFGTKYPFEKLDLVAVPEFWYGAMENAGLITFAEPVLLIDPKTVTLSQRRSNARITTHELAHMWFGDLVTMAWWDDLWLNESFADWMGDKIVDQVYPDFGLGEDELHNVQRIMDADASPRMPPLSNRNATPEGVLRTVGLAYNKGKSVIAMFEHWIGPEQFRNDVRHYLAAHAWGSATAADFETALGKTEGAAFDTFISQAGVPVVRAEIVGDNKVRLSQSRYFHAGSDGPAETWIIPVPVRYSNGTTTRETTLLLDRRSKSFDLDVKGLTWIYPQAGAVGYYRWSEPPAQFTALASNVPAALSGKECIAFLGNLTAMLDAGAIHGSDYLAAIQHLAGERDPEVISSILSSLEKIDSSISDSDRPLFSSYVRRILAPVVDYVGYTRRSGESESMTDLRPDLILSMSQHGDPKAIALGKELAATYMRDPAAVEPEMAGTALVIAAENGGDAALFDQYAKHFESASVPADRSRYLRAMSSFRSKDAREKLLRYALTDTLGARELLVLLMGQFDTEEGRDAAFQWVVANYDKTIRKRVPVEMRGRIVMVASGCDPARVARAKQFFLAPERNERNLESAFERVSEDVNECVAFRGREERNIETFLQSLN